LGWTDGRNVRIDIRWPAGFGADRVRQDASELVAAAPDVILATGGIATTPLQQLTRTVPIVFVVTADPVSEGYVASMARPGGNTTGFSFIEFGIAGKWLELLKQIAPGVTRVAVLREIPIGLGQLGAIQAVAPSFGVELFPIDVSSPDQIERAVSEFARGSNAGLIVTAGAVVIVHRKLFIALAARHRLPTVYWNRMYVADGGLISYGPDTIDQYRRAAAYVDRILKGEKPADLPVRAPTKYGNGRGSGGSPHAGPRCGHIGGPEGRGIAPAFGALKGRADALYVCGSPLFSTNRIRINTLALGARLPTVGRQHLSDRMS
jgi:putative tryptophan/tyrosine transport system substrate-binding protein